MKKVVIIGAGLGGLAAAIRLAQYGYSVTIVEKNERVGGKMDIVRRNGYTFDTGPSLLTMPSIIKELFTSVGEAMEDHITLVPVDPICRYWFSDGATLDASGNLKTTEEEIARLSPSDVEGFRKFIAHGERIYKASADTFLFQPFGSLDVKCILGNIKRLPAVAKLDAFRTLDDAVESFFADSRLRQLFNRFATYNGSSPYHAPATLAIIPYIEFAFGGWYVEGGMYKLAAALEGLAKRKGVRIQRSFEVSNIVAEGKRAKGILSKSGGMIPADIVISNADALYTHKELLNGSRGKFESVEPSLSGFVLLLGIRKIFPQLKHHNVFFSADYKDEFDVMFNHLKPSPDPTIYICQTSLSDSSHAPAGCSNIFVLVNAPPLRCAGADSSREYLFDWEKEKHEYRNLILRKLSALGLGDIEKHIEYEEIITPLDFERRYNAYRGSIYGTSSNSRMAAFLRPPNKSAEVENLYFAGGSSHPGGGIPLVLLSGKIVADMIQQQHGPA
ncbi:MAG: phytoene desaturase [Bacteroidetes bacterium]|nr:phytoene desaturase [Bacteroidota bacterium]MCW5894443.1 phytoene desaturase [Bacteroidota bacterium]